GQASSALEHFEKLSAGTSEIASESAYMAAVILFDQKKYDDSVSKFNNFVRIFPGSPRAQFASFNVGLAFFNMARYREAEEAFYAFLKGYPKSDFASRAWFNLGEISVLKKNYDGAHSWFMKISESDQLWLEAQLKICDIYQLQNDADKLSQKYEEVLKKADGVKADSESLIPVLFKMGKVLSALGKFDLAAAAYEKIIKVSKSERNSADARYKLASVHFARGDFEKSMNAVHELEGLKTGGGAYSPFEVKELLGRNLAGMRKYDEAAAVFEAIILDVQAPEHVKAIAKFSKGTALFAAQKFDQAIGIFEALASEIQDVEVLAKVHIALARCYSASEKNDEAIKNLLKIEILYHDSESLNEARLMLLELYVKTKKNKDARTLRDEILKSGASKAIKDKAKEISKK
ncbi:MAG TPA: tetratricopeptide repeat protein, partial [Candidatus Wallbacteria bacterium]|nr:tetratricopeptide repeat protein [Candidatus Wallbacteria bacterium]